MVLAVSVFLTLPSMQGSHHSELSDDRHGGVFLTMIALVPMQLAGFAGVLALLQSRHIKVAVGLARAAEQALRGGIVRIVDGADAVQ